ncbi:MAG: hypothetical protein M3R00_06510 [Pseudomonadota bacterium]|nr:hypothetical protein [Pseudomonadota bacterium]
MQYTLLKEESKPKEESKSRYYYSVNDFIGKAKQEYLTDSDGLQRISNQLRLAYQAPTLDQRLTELLKLREIVRPAVSKFKVARKLLKRCDKLCMIILDANNLEELEQRIQHRAERLIFDPYFVRDAPVNSPCRQLLDNLVDWQKTKNPIVAKRKLESIAKKSGRRFIEVHEKSTKKCSKETTESKMPPLRRIYTQLAFAHQLHHLLDKNKGNIRLVNLVAQAKDLQNNVTIFKDAELEQYRLLSYQNRDLQIKLEGLGDDAHFAVNPANSMGMSASGIYQDHALLVVKPNGDKFMGPTVGNTIVHSSYASGGPTFFCGRIKVVDGVLREIDNHTGHYLDRARSVFNIVQHFFATGIIGPHNQDILIGLLSEMYYLPPPRTDAFELYCKNNPLYNTECLLWEANKHLSTIAHKPEKCLEKIAELEKRTDAKKLPWKKAWSAEKSPASPFLFKTEYSYSGIYDRLASSPVNFNQYIKVKLENAKAKENEEPITWHVTEGLAATDDRARGIYNNQDLPRDTLLQNRAALKVLRKRIMQKAQLTDLERITPRFCQAEPIAANLEMDIIYFYPKLGHAKESFCGVKMKLPDGQIYENNLSYKNIDEIEKAAVNDDPIQGSPMASIQLRAHFDGDRAALTPISISHLRVAATTLELFEVYLLMPQSQLPTKKARGDKDPEQEIENNLRSDERGAFEAFKEERQTFIESLQQQPCKQAGNLFYGHMTRWRTAQTKGDKKAPYDPYATPNRYKVTIPDIEAEHVTNFDYLQRSNIK